MASSAFKLADEAAGIDASELECGTAPTIGSETRIDSSPHDRETAGAHWQKPIAHFERRMFTDGVMAMPDGRTVNFWGFEDPNAPQCARAFPSPAIRVREGETVHIKLEIETAVKEREERARTRTGSSASLKSASFIYQWQPRAAGTWLYQCHESSLKTFEMGLFGLLIVDPETDEDGRRRAYRGGPAYDVERCWIFDDIDPNWHDGTAGGETKRDVAFAPQYFLVNGVANVETREHPEVAIDARCGDKVLLRLLNASFSLVRTRIEKLHGDIISVDGKPLQSADRPWMKGTPVKAGQPVYMATGARHDMLIDLNPEKIRLTPGDEFEVTFEFLDFNKRQVRNADAAAPLYVGRAVTRIRIV